MARMTWWKMYRPWQDSNLQSPDPKSGALSIGPYGQSYLRAYLGTWYLSFFSTHTIFGSIFSTQKCVNRDKIDFTTKQRKSQQNLFFTKQHTCVHVKIFSTWYRCEETSVSTYVMWRKSKLPNMWGNVRFLHICHVEKSEITSHVEKVQISPHLSWK